MTDDWTLLWRLGVMSVLVVLIVSHIDWHDTPTFSKTETAWLDQRIAADRIAKAEATVSAAVATCARAAKTARLADAKADWLRAHLLTFYQRYGQGRMAKRLSPWPGGDAEPMEAIR